MLVAGGRGLGRSTRLRRPVASRAMSKAISTRTEGAATVPACSGCTCTAWKFCISCASYVAKPVT
jgi:hypothetical protein